MLVDISEQKMITTQFEEHLFKEYGAYFTEEQAEENGNYCAGNTTKDFIIDILANRYFLQEDYGKAFLLQNSVTDLEYNPDLKILLAIEKLHDKSNKNAFEKYITNNITPTVYIYEVKKFQKVPDFNFEEYVAQMKGSIYLRLGKLKEAKKEFKKVTANFTLPRYYSEDENGKTIIKKQTYDVPYDGYSNIKRDVFGTNRIECFTCEGTVDTYYLEEFPFIKPSMNKAELTDALIQLDKIAEKKDELAAKANYLLGNFYFNTSTLGYFRQLFTFNITNDNSPKFSRYRYFSTSYSAKFYFKNYSNEASYIDDFKLPLAYLDKGLALAQDKELKAKLLFTAAKAEQGLFYDEGEPIFSEQHGKDGIYSEEYRIKLLQYKAQNYRSYFEKLKDYSDTQYYEEVKSNCNFFDYYVTHY